MLTCPRNETPLHPTLVYSKTGVYRGTNNYSTEILQNIAWTCLCNVPTQFDHWQHDEAMVVIQTKHSYIQKVVGF